MADTKYVVGSQSREWIELPRIRDGWHLGNDGQHAPVGLRHAVHVDAAASPCGLSVSLLYVFDNLDWGTMISNQMCSDCKNAEY